ncbi:SGNH/GDSL hydrolase family protein [Streptomyces sp. V3I7]|uniref:SGNH/GDSL hydrolase family protein n=1 Tax=Streptomyces sp. V3I7 TaxID=3042278 RepID=UPI00278A2315|nr:SGNH/GDSL hydrolase family protein [Streptomyces sp. V3I7]MDQ0991133.1 lysophospholipase L1-like esterase [Streptomyces sp. V3I7]
MTRGHGYAVLSSIVALVVGLSTAIYVGVSADDGTPLSSIAGNRPHRDASAAPASAGTWVGAWSASPVGGEPGTLVRGMAGRSVRNVVHASVGGTSARITLSNLYGRTPLTITHASIAVAVGDNSAEAAAETMRRLSFGGNASVVIPPGGQVLSDAVRVNIPHDTDVLVTTYSPTASGPVTYHPQSRQMSYVALGDHTEDATGTAYTQQTPYWRYLTALDVLSNASDGTVVVLGDSITDGYRSTVGANRRWTDVLSERLRTDLADGRSVPRYTVVNQGISGNRVLTDGGSGRPAGNESALGRFGRDVLSRTNVKVVVIDLGVNDILHNPRLADAGEITDGLRTLVRQAHARGLKVIGATLMPFQGHRGYTPARDAVRQEVNAMIRSGQVYDAVVDFDQALKDPYNPLRLRPEYDSGDHLHPSDAGYQKMAETFDLRELKGAGQAEL